MDAQTYELMTGLHKNPELMETATLAQLREIRDRMNARWRARIDVRIHDLTNMKPGEPWPFEAPVSPLPIHPSPWNTRPGTPARHDEEEETIHGVN